MPLDTGAMVDLEQHPGEDPGSRAAESFLPTLQSGADIGQALKVLREARGLSLEDVADTTRVRRAYLAAIEEMRLEALPSRPFTIGYIRAYAAALGADPETAVERFKAEEPVLDEPLRAPVGVNHDRDPRVAAIVVGACLILVAIVLWNVAQRAMSAGAPPSPTAPESAAARALETPSSGAFALGAPLPAPVESTTPPLYETPGLDRAVTSADGVTSLNLHAPGPSVEAPSDLNLPPTFTPQGAIYGAPAPQASPIVLQALQPASLIVRGADGSVYFARQLAAGEAYRAPNLAGLSVEVSAPEDFQVFVAGQSKGFLPAAKAPLDKIVGG